MIDLTYVQTIVTDNCDRVWAGSISGLSLVNDGKHRLFTKREGLPCNEVTAILPNGYGAWVGTREGLAFISILDYMIIKTSLAVLPNAHVTALVSNSQGLWVGTYGGGIALNKPNTEEWEYFTEGKGLTDNLIVTLMVDNDNVWVGSNNGISCIKPDKTRIEFE